MPNLDLTAFINDEVVRPERTVVVPKAELRRSRRRLFSMRPEPTAAGIGLAAEPIAAFRQALRRSR